MAEKFSNIPALFRETSARLSDKTAMRKKELGIWNDITWNEYYETSRSLAAAFLHFGLEKGQCVSIIGENCPEWVFADMGIIMAGGVSVGIYTTNSAEQCQYVIDNSESVFLFVENEEQLDKWLAVRDELPRLKKVIFWDDKGLRDFKDPMVMSFGEFVEKGREVLPDYQDKIDKICGELSEDDPAILVYTSGTTGQPKGAILSHRNLTWMAATIAEMDPEMDINENENVVSFLPLCHIFERLFSVFIHVKVGYQVNFVEGPDTVMENIQEISPSVGYAVPRIWEKYYSAVFIKMSDATRFKKLAYFYSLQVCMKYTERKFAGQEVSGGLRLLWFLSQKLVFNKLRERLGLERMKIAFSGAAPISPDVLKFFWSIGLPMVEGYGQTEGTGVAAAAMLSAFKPGSVGRPVPGTEIRLAEDGEILVKAPSVFQGYYRRPEATEEVLKDGWLHSGDIGEFDKEGFLKIIDRKKDLIITAGGKNIAPQNIENKIKFSPYVNDAIVIGDRKKFLSALIVLDEDNVVKYAQDNKVQFSTYSDLATNDEINKLIQKEIDKVNKDLARVESIRKFRILPKKLLEEDGEMTPTMKVKRSYVNKTYKELIEEMYSSRN